MKLAAFAIALVVAGACVTAGATMIYPPTGLIVGGTLFGGLVWLLLAE